MPKVNLWLWICKVDCAYKNALNYIRYRPIVEILANKNSFIQLKIIDAYESYAGHHIAS